MRGFDPECAWSLVLCGDDTPIGESDPLAGVLCKRLIQAGAHKENEMENKPPIKLYWPHVVVIVISLIILFFLLGTITYATGFGRLNFNLTYSGSILLGIPLGVLNIILGIYLLVGGKSKRKWTNISSVSNFIGIAGVILGLLSFLIFFIWASFTQFHECPFICFSTFCLIIINQASFPLLRLK